MTDRADRQSLPPIRLREVREDDLPILFEHQLDPEANQMAATHPRDAEAFYAHWAKILRTPGLTPMAILAGDELVGQIACFSMEGKDSIGYWIAKEYWGRGIATRALALLLERVPTRPLYAAAARSNVASIRVLERNGFRVVSYRVSPATDRYPECEEAVLILEAPAARD